MSHYLPFDPERKTVSFFAAHFATQPEVARMAENLGCDIAVAARIAAVKVYQSGWRTTTVADVTLTCRVETPVGPLDDPPPPGKEQDRAA
jgi:hypothetical protein